MFFVKNSCEAVREAVPGGIEQSTNAATPPLRLWDAIDRSVRLMRENWFGDRPAWFA